MKPVSLTQTCDACPSQWEGELEDGRDFYIRYRWGQLRVDVPFRTTIFTQQIGDNLHGVLSTGRMKQLTKHLFEW